MDQAGWRGWLSIGLLLAGWPWPAAARTLHVAPDGDDAAAGTEEAPWATLQRAAREVRAGDTVLVRAGRYAGFLVDSDPARDGTPEQRVVWQVAAGEEGRVIIDRPSPENYLRGGTQNLIDLTRTHHWTLDGFVLEGATRAGLAILGFSDDPVRGVTVRGCVARHNRSWGIFTGFADDLLLEGNEASGSAEQHGIYVSNTSRRPVVRGNHLHDNRGCGLHLNGDASAGGAGYIFDARIEDNRIHGNGRGPGGGGSAINCDGCRGGLIRNNLLYDTGASGISLFTENAAGPSTDNVVVNNTILQAADGRWGINLQGGATGTLLFHNLIWTDHPFRGSVAVCRSCLAGFVSDFNLLRPRVSADGDETILDLAAWQALGHDRHSQPLTAREQAVDEVGRPWAGSLAVDRGTAALGGVAAPERDIDGTLRPQGGSWEIGAWELCPAAGCREVGPVDAGVVAVDAGMAPGDLGPEFPDGTGGATEAGTEEVGALDTEPDERDAEAGLPQDRPVAATPAGCSCASAPRSGPDLSGLLLLLLGIGRRPAHAR